MKHLVILIVFTLGCQIDAMSQKVDDFRLNCNKWIIVSPGMFKRLNIDTSKIQIIDIRKPEIRNHSIQSEDSVQAKIYIDRAGQSYFWIKPSYATRKRFVYRKNPKKNYSVISRKAFNSYKRRVIKKEPDSTSLAQKDEFLEEIMSRFGGDFIIKPPYAIHPHKEGEELSLIGYVVEGNMLIYDRTDLVLENIKTGKELLIVDSTDFNASLSTLLFLLYGIETIEEALEYFLAMNGRYNGTGNNVDFLKHYFTSLIPNAHKIYPEFVPIPIELYMAVGQYIEPTYDDILPKRIQFQAK